MKRAAAPLRPPAGVLTACVLLVFALASGVAHAANAFVTMRDVTFQPASVPVNVGESVTWTNQDGIPHSAKADNGSFDTGVFSTGSRSVTFTSAGTIGYFCAVHPTVMRGTVRVLGAATPAPTPPPTPSITATATASPAPVAVQTTLPPTSTPASETTTTSRSDEGPGPLVAGAAALGVAALIGFVAYLRRRP